MDARPFAGLFRSILEIGCWIVLLSGRKAGEFFYAESIAKEMNACSDGYGSSGEMKFWSDELWQCRHSIIPSFHHSIIPSFHHSNTPLLRCLIGIQLR